MYGRPCSGPIGPYIKWRVEGTEGLAEGTIGWPGYPNRQPSTIRYYSNRSPGVWIEPRWPEVWFPDAFSGPMAELMDAITKTGNLRTAESTTSRRWLWSRLLIDLLRNTGS